MTSTVFDLVASGSAVITAASKDTGDVGPNWPWWLKLAGAIAVVLLGSSALTATFGAFRADAAARRTQYTAAARALTSWTEYPYRIRRRTSDLQETLAALAERGHDLQETLADRQAWCAAEHEVLGGLFAHLRAELSTTVGPAIEAAWTSPPVTTAAGMHLGPSFVVQSRSAEVRACFSACVHERFGWRRRLPNLTQRVNKQLSAHGFRPLSGGPSGPSAT